MDALPDCHLLKIFSFLNLHDLIDCVRLTCMRWHTLSYDFSLWRVLHLEADKPPSCGERALILEVADIVEELTLEQSCVHDEKTISLYNILGTTLHCSNLKRLHLLRMKITKDQLSSLVADYPLLEELTMINWFSTGCLVNHVQYLKHLSRLRHLEVTENYGTQAAFKEDLSANMPDLVALTLDGVHIYHDAIGMLLKTAPGLTKLHLRNCTMGSAVILQDSIPNRTQLESLDITQSSFDDECLMRILARCPKLRSLSIQYCTNITDKSVAFVFDACKNLECLNASKAHHDQKERNENIGPKISDNGLKNIFGNCQHFRKLDIRNNTAIGDTSICHLAKCCPNIEDLDLSMSKITDESVISLSRFSSRLRILDISRCCSITGASISQLVMRCIRLSSLSLFGCSGVKDINLCAFYQSIVTGNSGKECPNVHETQHGSLTSDESSFCIDHNCMIEHASCQGKIPDQFGLSVLDLSHTSVTAESLLQVAAHCPNLVDLRLQNCCLVTDEAILFVIQRCRQLQNLNLSGWYGPQRMILSNLSLCAIAKFGENIEELSICFNSLITIKGIKEVIVGCKLLKYFSCSVSRAFVGTKKDISKLKAVIPDRYQECAVKDIHYAGEPRKRRMLKVLLNPR